MKRIFLALFLTLITITSAKAETKLEKLSNENTQLKIEINELKNSLKNLSEKNYVRIPNKDFEEIINSKAINIIDEKLDMKLGNIELLLGFSATIILAIISFAFNQAITNTKSKIQIDVLEEINEVLTKKLSEIEKKFISEKRTNLPLN